MNMDDPECGFMNKAIHSIAAAYIQERKAGDILLQEFREFEAQQVLLETDNAAYIAEIEKLSQAREADG